MMRVTCTLIPLESEEFARFPSMDGTLLLSEIVKRQRLAPFHTTLGDVPMPSHIKGSCRNVVQSCWGCSHQGPGTSEFLPASIRHINRKYSKLLSLLQLQKAMATMVRFTLAKPLLQYGIWTKTCTKIKSILFHYKL